MVLDGLVPDDWLHRLWVGRIQAMLRDYMLLEDLYDRCMDDDEPTAEEIEESIQMAQDYANLEKAWEAAGRKCRCGNPISLQDAWQYGFCNECLHSEAPCL